MASYYYLIASLPELGTTGDMPITYSEFLSCCQSNVSEKDYEWIKIDNLGIDAYRDGAAIKNIKK